MQIMANNNNNNGIFMKGEKVGTYLAKKRKLTTKIHTKYYYKLYYIPSYAKANFFSRMPTITKAVFPPIEFSLVVFKPFTAPHEQGHISMYGVTCLFEIEL